MKTLLSIISLVLSTSSFAVTLPQASSVVQGGGGTANTVGPTATVPLANIGNSSLTMICASSNSDTAGNFYAMYSQTAPGSTTPFQVTNGKVFYAYNVFYGSGAAGNAVQFGYGTATFTDGTSSPPTGSVTYGTSAVSAAGAVSGFRGPTAANGSTNYAALGLQFPSGTFPYARFTASAAVVGVCVQGIMK